ncbi:hypothetical protein P3T76_013014 [Phytophthora citrophthora]|uniref:Uncharacterized protein n=1 Tax=Phytophthora citrophthora TaxID=4793 RepID=A0AAD9LCT4_9STRA|nr:hypothetical protein P3T76_013014 [Phytophthora citrophthora]
MSEDEFVVLLEHAGILETSDENDMEFMEETVLREWLERDGVQLFTTQMTTTKNDTDLVVDGNASTAPTATATATTLVGEARTRMAGHILARLLERGWIAPIEFDYEEDETEEWKTKLYTPRLRTTEAYRIYIEKDPTATQLTARGFHLRAHELRKVGLSVGPYAHPFSKPWACFSCWFLMLVTEQDGAEMPPPVPVSVADNDMKSRLREKMWQDCFPTCSESAKQTFLSFTRPEIILYATLGLNLISNGISSVPAFSRELKSMGVTSADDRSIIVGFLAKAFPTE